MQKGQLFFLVLAIFLCASIVSAAENDTATTSSETTSAANVGAAVTADTSTTTSTDTSTTTSSTDVEASAATETSTATSTDASATTETEVKPEDGVAIEADSENPDAELRGAGITPDSAFYFVEESILSKFRSDLSNVEKKAAEIKEMIEQGKITEARIALARYNEFADRLEKEIDPENQEEAKRIAAAIRNSVAEISSQIPDADKEEFNSIVEKSDKIKTAAEIAGKIKELCETLSKLDPLQYESTCKTGDDAPKWQKKLDKELTKEQREEAEAFFGTMSQCFENPAKCQCNEIKVQSFAEACSEIAPLAVKCEQEGDEEACQQMEEIPDPIDLLPEHLQLVMEEIEQRYNNDRIDHFMPPECKEAGATSPKACMEVMFRVNAPEECIAALDAGKIDLSNERKAREACEKIMFEANAPEECIEAGLTDHRECGKLMFKQSAPEECLDAGITGEKPNDPNKCRKLMESLGKEDREGPGGRGPGGYGPAGMNCKSIQNAEERLKCFDSALTNSQGEFRERYDANTFPPECVEANKVEPKACNEYMRKLGEERYGAQRDQDREQYRPEDQNRQQYQDGQYPPQGQPYPGQYEGQQPPQDQQYQQPTDTTQQQPSSDSTQQAPSPTTDSESTTESSSSSSSESSSDSSSSSSSDSGGGDSSSSDSSSSTSSDSGSSSGTTGAVIFSSDNRFLNYRYG